MSTSAQHRPVTRMSDMDLSLLGKHPIGAKNPTGQDTKDDAEFYDLQSAVQKAVSVFNGGVDEWETIVHLASSLLSQKSKDMVVAGYLAVGLIHSRGLEGFVIGSGVYMDLIENYWEDLYPAKSRPVGRSRAIAWWLEKTESALKSLGSVTMPPRQAEALSRRFEATQSLLKASLDDAPSVRPILDWMAAASSSSVQETPVVSATSATPAESSMGMSASETLTDAQWKPAFSRWVEEARRLSSYLATRDTSNPLLYRLNRLAAWVGVEDLPLVQGGHTLLAPPEQRLMDRLQDVRRRGDYSTLLTLVEDETSRYLFWLDLQRYAAEALSAMGERFAGAADTVGRETIAFVERLKGIETLTFSDGTPFADVETRRWLAGLTAAPAPEATPIQTPVSTTLDRSAHTEDMAEIRKLVRAKKSPEAAARFQARLEASRSAREKLEWRMAFVQVLADTPGATMIASQVEAILQDIDRYQLNEFDPELALRGITIALKACRSANGSVSKEKSEELLQRVARIDLVEFLKQGG